MILSPSLCADCNGGHGFDSHNSELLSDRSVWAAPASVPLAKSRDDHRLHRLTGGRLSAGSANAGLSAISSLVWGHQTCTTVFYLFVVFF